ncbi:MAG: restriction endonuclease subunit S [Saprospiraceae bacterium]|nr:restriction endonuclease subunit S [Saprospiraceae bacterium]MBK9631892.1 restriction endonuclease subunit S [Saprospiraceae bacterium]
MSKDKLIPDLRFSEFQKEEEWIVKILGDVAEFVNEKTTLKNLSINTYISTENLLADYSGVTSSSKLPSSGNFTKYTVEDILISNIRPYLKKVWYSDREGGCSNDVFVVRAKMEICKVFLSFILRNDVFINYVMVGAKGVKMPRGDKNLISKYQIFFPKNKSEQQKIASCLSSLDEVIDAQSHKLDLLKEHKKGLMQNLFPQEGEKVPKYRFKEFEKDGEWVEKSFENLFEIGNGRDYKHLGKGKIPVYGSGGYMLSVDEYLCDGESVCIGRKGTIDKPMFLTGKFWTVDTLFYTHQFKNSLPKYILYVFENINWREHNEAGGVPSLSKTNIYKIKVLVPPNNDLEEQQKIASCLTSLDSLITAQAEKIEQLKLHKKGLMQGLFPKVKD